MSKQPGLERFRGYNSSDSNSNNSHSHPDAPSSNWLGLRGKTLWDVVELLLIPVVLLGGIVYLAHQADRRQEQAALEQQMIEGDRYEQERVQTYLNEMNEALETGLRESSSESEPRTIARARTLVTLREVSGDRKGLLLQYLYDAGLINTPEPVVALNRADLEGAALEGATLNSSMLNGAILNEANLSFSFLSGSNLDGAELQQSDMRGAFVSETMLRGGFLRGADLTSADLQGADLRFAILSGATLSNAKLNNAVLTGATLSDVDLSGANLEGVNLDFAFLCNTTMPNGEVENRNCPPAE